MVYLSICFLFSLISFISVLEFPAYRSFVSLGRFIPRYFILFVAVVNGIVSLISLSEFSLLVYRNSRDFCGLILYPMTLLNSLISSSSFLMAFLGFSLYSICASVVKNQPAVQEMKDMWVQSLGQEDPLEEGMATHPSILAWRLSWTEEPDRLQSIRSQRLGHDWSDWGQHRAHTCRIVSSADSQSFISSFPIWFPFLFLLCCCGYDFQNYESCSETLGVGTIVLFLIWGEMLSILRIVFAVGLSYMAFIMLRLVPTMLIFWRVLFCFVF